jgi:hypothetical protein
LFLVGKGIRRVEWCHSYWLAMISVLSVLSNYHTLRWVREYQSLHPQPLSLGHKL